MIKMKAIFIIFNILFLTSIIKSDDVQPIGGAVSVVIENLPLKTAEVTDETQLGDVLNKVEIITATAMERLGDAVLQASSKLPECPQNWTMTQLFERIHDELIKCTENLLNFRTVFQSESQNLLQGLQAYIAQLSAIPARCAVLSGIGTNNLSSNFASSTACFVQQLAELNGSVSQLMAQENAPFVRTRRSLRAEAAVVTTCSNAVVNDIVEFLNDAFEKC